MQTFTVNRSLLNPKFEGYKLNPISQDAVARYALQHKPIQATVSGRSPLSFQEVQSRISHNHLVVANDGARALYIDSEYRVIIVDVNLASSS